MEYESGHTISIADKVEIVSPKIVSRFDHCITTVEIELVSMRENRGLAPMPSPC